MTDSRVRKLFSSLIVIIPVCVLIYALFNQGEEDIRPKAENGIIDLSRWSFGKGNVPLNGDWSFTWEEPLHTNADFDTALAAGTPIRVPGIWNGKEVGGKKIPALRYGTYRVKIKFPEYVQGQQQCAFSILTMSNAY